MYNNCSYEISDISSKSSYLYWKASNINDHTVLLKIIGEFYDLLLELDKLSIKYNDGLNLFRITQLSWLMNLNIKYIKDKLNKTKSTTFTLEDDVNIH
jgi:hypothetical protein